MNGSEKGETFDIKAENSLKTYKIYTSLFFDIFKFNRKLNGFCSNPEYLTLISTVHHPICGHPICGRISSARKIHKSGTWRISENKMQNFSALSDYLLISKSDFTKKIFKNF